VDGRYLLGFAGREEAAGLLYFGARYYLPGLRVFAAPDSLGSLDLESPLLWSRYGYAAWNPVRYADDGEMPLLIAAVVVALTVVDVVTTAYDVYQAINDPTPENVFWAAVGVAGLVLPGDEMVDAVKLAVKYGDEVVSVAKVAVRELVEPRRTRPSSAASAG